MPTMQEIKAFQRLCKIDRLLYLSVKLFYGCCLLLTLQTERGFNGTEMLRVFFLKKNPYWTELYFQEEKKRREKN